MNNLAAEHIDTDDNVSPLCRINQQYSSMSRSQRKIANYFSAHEQEVLKYSITTLSSKIGTTPSAISRFCQALHYKGFTDFKFCMEKEIISPNMSGDEFSANDEPAEIKKKFLSLYNNILTDTLLNLDDRMIKLAARALMNANHVYIYSTGSSGSSANYAYQLLLQSGIPCNYFMDRQMALISIGHLQKGDVALAINFSGNSSTSLELLTLAKQSNVTTIAITSNSQSYLGRMVDFALCYSTLVEDDIRHMHAARMCELAIIGVLQTTITNMATDRIENNLKYSKIAIEKSRSK